MRTIPTINQILKDFREGLTLHGRKKVFDEKVELESSFVSEKANPEEFTKKNVIEPILSNFSLKLVPERHFRGISSLRKVDYHVTQERTNNKFLIEAKPVCADLFKKTSDGAVNQIKGLFRLVEVKEEYLFGIATDGFRWIFISESRILYDLNIKEDYKEISKLLSGKEEVTIRRFEEEISKKFYDWYRALLFGGSHKDHDQKVRSIPEEDSLINNIFGLKNQDERKIVAQLSMNRLIFIKLLLTKGLIPDDIFDYFLSMNEDLLNIKLKHLFFSVMNNPESERYDVDKKFSKIPYLNGSLFDRSDIELKYPDYRIKAEILYEILKFLISFSFSETEDFLDKSTIDPEILGFIFERLMTSEERKGYHLNKEFLKIFYLHHIFLTLDCS